ncbi:hypothetical protein CVT24_012302 [Panaeolus cyanescens]|uniref:Uncharacterized protein n=1 Tax=Panaeolus cyanescens TaxID=181874 RepID=A0A409W4A9_9AGAR|nr:hypothetical protein CVT24_012302 [Panaeolus cyanescens]
MHYIVLGHLIASPIPTHHRAASNKVSQLVAFISIVALTASAVEICFHANTLSCSGTSTCCKNVGSNTCCNAGASAVGYSIKYKSLPNLTTAQAWTVHNCASYETGIKTFLNGPGDRCWTGGGTRAPSAVWTYGTNGRLIGTSSPSGDCQDVDTFRYTDGNGVEQDISITAESTFEVLQALVDAGDFDALAALHASN